jgi:hypothetical protein
MTAVTTGTITRGEPMKMTFTTAELTTIIDALAIAASRREAQANAVKYGRHHDEAANAIRILRVRFVQERWRGRSADGREEFCPHCNAQWRDHTCP